MKRFALTALLLAALVLLFAACSQTPSGTASDPAETEAPAPSDPVELLLSPNVLGEVLKTNGSVSAVFTDTDEDGSTTQITVYCDKDGRYYENNPSLSAERVYLDGKYSQLGDGQARPAFSTHYLPGGPNMESTLVNFREDEVIVSDKTVEQTRQIESVLTVKDGEEQKEYKHVFLTGKDDLLMREESFEGENGVRTRGVFTYGAEPPEEAKAAFAACEATRDAIAALGEDSLRRVTFHYDGEAYTAVCEKGGGVLFNDDDVSVYFNEERTEVFPGVRESDLNADADFWVGERAIDYGTLCYFNSPEILAARHKDFSYTDPLAGITCYLEPAEKLFFMETTGEKVYSQTIVSDLSLLETGGSIRQYYEGLTVEQYSMYFNDLYFSPEDGLTVTRFERGEDTIAVLAEDGEGLSVSIVLAADDFRALSATVLSAGASVTEITGGKPTTFAYDTERPEAAERAVAYAAGQAALTDEECRRLTIHYGEGTTVLRVKKGEGFYCGDFLRLYADEELKTPGEDDFLTDREFWASFDVSSLFNVPVSDG